MASLPNNFKFGSPSATRVIDVIESYRRSQYLSVGTEASVVSSTEFPISSSVEDEESHIGIIEEEEEDVIEEEGDGTPATPVRPRNRRGDSFVDGLDWDENVPDPDAVETPATLEAWRRIFPVGRSREPRSPVSSSRGSDVARSSISGTGAAAGAANENTPLIRKSVSFSHLQRPERMDSTSTMTQSRFAGQTSPPSKPLIRRGSTASVKSGTINYGGKSTFGQSLFNSIAILLGIGMLSEPLAFAYAGWIGGTFLVIFFGFITCYTAKLLAKIILEDPRLRSYADIGRKAFGPRSTPFTTALFFLELFAVSVILVTLFADSLHSIIPTYEANTYKLMGLVILIPTVLLPLSLLSYASIVGILSTGLLIVAIVIDGLSKKEGPGSLWQPAETSLSFQSWGRLGVAFGLFMAGFSGHAVIPSLARDMVDPSQFNYMLNIAWVIATAIYAIIGAAGYLMFGDSVNEEVSRNLLSTPGYNPQINRAALWMLVISPLTKFALATRPLNITIEVLLGFDSVEWSNNPESSFKLVKTTRWNTLKRFFIVLERIAFAVVVVLVSILVPDFGSMMAFLGSFSAFVLCVIYPVCSKIALEKRVGLWDVVLLIMAIVMAAWGTGAAFLSS